MAEVFLSYSSKDASAADATVGVLEDAGISCWYAPRDIGPGSVWSERIVTAIDQCKVFVLLFSGNSNTSQQVLREVEHAVSCGRVILPIRIESLMPSPGLGYYVKVAHWFDAHQGALATHLPAIVRAVAGALKIELPLASSRPRVQVPRYTSFILLSLLAAAMIAVLLAIWWSRAERNAPPQRELTADHSAISTLEHDSPVLSAPPKDEAIRNGHPPNTLPVARPTEQSAGARPAAEVVESAAASARQAMSQARDAHADLLEPREFGEAFDAMNDAETRQTAGELERSRELFFDASRKFRIATVRASASFLLEADRVLIIVPPDLIPDDKDSVRWNKASNEATKRIKALVKAGRCALPPGVSEDGIFRALNRVSSPPAAVPGSMTFELRLR